MPHILLHVTLLSVTIIMICDHLWLHIKGNGMVVKVMTETALLTGAGNRLPILLGTIFPYCTHTLHVLTLGAYHLEISA